MVRRLHRHWHDISHEIQQDFNNEKS